jgi:hypothetical protein
MHTDEKFLTGCLENENVKGDIEVDFIFVVPCIVTLNKIQQDATICRYFFFFISSTTPCEFWLAQLFMQVFIYYKITLHVSGVHRTHHQEHIKL